MHPVSLHRLEAKFVLYDGGSIKIVSSLEEAQGLLFLCPKCFEANKGPQGTHSILCWFSGRGIPNEASPGPGRWRPQGTSLDNLTFVGPGATSVCVRDGCLWHGFVRNGTAG